MNDTGDPSEDDGSDRINIDYIKSHLFRTIAPNGLLASLTPQDALQIAIFSERQAIPQRVVHKYRPDGTLGDILEVIGRDAVVREVEAVVTLDRATARTLIDALQDLLKELADREEQSK